MWLELLNRSKSLGPFRVATSENVCFIRFLLAPRPAAAVIYFCSQREVLRAVGTAKVIGQKIIERPASERSLSAILPFMGSVSISSMSPSDIACRIVPTARNNSPRVLKRTHSSRFSHREQVILGRNCRSVARTQYVHAAQLKGVGRDFCNREAAPHHGSL